MLDKSIDGALLALRKQIIRGDGEGLAHVEALLRLRKVPLPRVLPVKRPNAAKRGHMRLLVLDALRGGPKPYREIVAYVSERRPDIAYAASYQRTGQVLWKLRNGGVVHLDRRLWELTVSIKI
ncbi:MAG: hypothetical protein WAT77_05740 [Paracoccaceae bacterium]